MSYLASAQQNKVNRDKAQAFDTLQQQTREQQLYQRGANDAYTDVERVLMERAQQEYMQRQLYEAARNQEFANQDVRGPAARPNLPAPKPVVQPDTEGLAATIQDGLRTNAYKNAMFRAQQEGNMTEANINRLVEEELGKVGGL